METKNFDSIPAMATFYVRGDLSLEQARNLLDATKRREVKPDQVPVVSVFVDMDPKKARHLRRVITSDTR